MLHDSDECHVLRLTVRDVLAFAGVVRERDEQIERADKEAERAREDAIRAIEWGRRLAAKLTDVIVAAGDSAAVSNDAPVVAALKAASADLTEWHQFSAGGIW